MTTERWFGETKSDGVVLAELLPFGGGARIARLKAHSTLKYE
jgi:hypothetical protein